MRERSGSDRSVAIAVEGKTTIDPKGYMTAMAATPISSDSDIQDIKRTRQLFKSITTSNPKNPAGWVGAAVSPLICCSMGWVGAAVSPLVCCSVGWVGAWM